jgi:hypothetical protein
MTIVLDGSLREGEAEVLNWSPTIANDMFWEGRRRVRVA